MVSMNESSEKSTWSLIWIIIIGIAGGHTNAVMPALIGTLSRTGGIDIGRVGLIASLELVSMTITVVSVATFINQVQPKRIARCGSILMLAGNIASLLWSTYFPLIIFRFFTGIGAGLVLGLSSRMLIANKFKISSSPQRTFGIFYIFLTSLSFLAYQTWVFWVKIYGIKGPFIWLSIIACMCVLASFSLHEEFVVHKKSTDQNYEISIIWWGVALIGIFLINAAGNCLWSQAVGLGIYKGIRAEGIYPILSYITLSQLCAMIISTFIGSRLGQKMPIVFGGAGLFIGMLLVVMSHTQFAFAVSLFTFIFFWSFVTPFIMGSSSILDPKGRLATLSVAALYGGVAIAPALAGAMLKKAGGEYTSVFYLSISVMPLSLLLLMYALSHPVEKR